MNVWDEDWVADGEYLRRANGTAVFIGDSNGDGSALNAETAKLAAQAPAMARLLLKLKRDIEDGDLYVDEGAKLAVSVASVLRSAGVLP